MQSKWIRSGFGEPNANEISTFADGVRDLVENAIDSFAERLHEKVEIISEALMQPGNTIRLIVVSTGSSDLAKHTTRKLDRLVNELNDHEAEGIATSSVLGMSEVFKGADFWCERWQNHSRGDPFGLVEGYTSAQSICWHH